MGDDDSVYRPANSAHLTASQLQLQRRLSEWESSNMATIERLVPSRYGNGMTALRPRSDHFVIVATSYFVISMKDSFNPSSLIDFMNSIYKEQWYCVLCICTSGGTSEAPIADDEACYVATVVCLGMPSNLYLNASIDRHSEPQFSVL